MKEFNNRVAVVTGAGTGMGRALARQLVREGCHLAICDIVDETLAETESLCNHDNPHRVRIVSGVCDVADEAAVLAFRDATLTRLDTRHINLLINNAGINGGGSFVLADRDEWERAFNICWNGVYFNTRAFLPALLASEEGHLVNIASANALRATLGEHAPHTAYSAAKFTIRGFSEALINDFRFNAPHLKVSVVMPGAVGTEIMSNSSRILGNPVPEDWTPNEVDTRRQSLTKMGASLIGADPDQRPADMSDDEIRAIARAEIEMSRSFGLTPDEAAEIILQGVREERWRILVGRDTEALDRALRESPERAYDGDFLERWRAAFDPPLAES